MATGTAPRDDGERSASGRDFTVTFTTPHQRVTAGGVYAIQQFARHLAPLMKVNLVVRRGDPSPIPGVSVYSSEKLLPGELPDGDAIVLYINAPNSEAFFDLPDRKGERLLFFQGYQDRNSELVRERLTLGLRVLAVSRWLVEEARSLGSTPIYTPNGLDPSIFYPGPPTEQRRSVIALRSHPMTSKGTADGIAALQKTTESWPDAELHVFGPRPRNEPLPIPCTYHAFSSQAEVAELLRRSAIYVCSSWQEGFGLPGLESLACGTALATTDTKGSRDYAIHEETALVSPPRDPDELARNVLRLLDDLELRGRLSARGIEFATTHFKPWPEAARVMARALLERPEP